MAAGGLLNLADVRLWATLQVVVNSHPHRRMDIERIQRFRCHKADFARLAARGEASAQHPRGETQGALLADSPTSMAPPGNAHRSLSVLWTIRIAPRSSGTMAVTEGTMLLALGAFGSL